jgi:hypothetical protein
MGVWKQAGGELRRLVKMAVIAAIGLAFIGVASLFSDQPAATFFTILSLIGTGLLLFSVAMMVLTFRRAKALVPGALLISLITTLLVALVQILFSPDQVPGTAIVLVLVVGAAVGAGWARTSLVFVDDRSVRSRGTAWYLVVWALTFLFNQLMRPIAGASGAGVLLLVLGTGVAVGSILIQLWRYRRAVTLIAARTSAIP